MSITACNLWYSFQYSRYRRVKPLCLCSWWKSPWCLNVDREHIERSNIFSQTLRLCGGHWGAVQVRDQRLHLSSSSTQTSTLEQQLQHCCCSPADIQRSHYCWASAFDLNHQPRVCAVPGEAFGRTHCCPGGARPAWHLVPARDTCRAPPTPLQKFE